MEADCFLPGNIIYTEQHSLKTSNGSSSSILSGRMTEYGYYDGIGEGAMLNNPLGFVQLSPAHVVVCDTGNHCLRLIDRFSGMTTEFAGKCLTPGHRDGKYALFYSPNAAIIDVNNRHIIIVSDFSNNAIRTVHIYTRMVSTLLRSRIVGLNVLSITQDFTSGDLFLITVTGIYKSLHYGPSTLSTELIAGGSSRGYKDGDLNQTEFHHISGMVKADNDLFLVADQNNNAIRLLDLKRQVSSTLKLCESQQKCSSSFHTPRALLLTNGSLYIALHGAIRQYKGNLTSCYQIS